ncbi:tail protein X [Acinetobacter sp. c3-l95]|uniref:tail protein X n=1 Tax=Acinetobacter sp. c3-l95 TaxID=3342804 RepID=UPI0035B7F295
MALKEYLQHIASDGDRWDTLSYQYYGEPTGYEPIVVANRHLPIHIALKAGQIVLIPIIEKNDSTISDIPAWLRSE